MLQVYPHGSTDSLPYCTMGSGSLNAMAVFEASYEEDMTQEQAEALVARAIRSGGWPCGVQHVCNVPQPTLEHDSSHTRGAWEVAVLWLESFPVRVAYGFFWDAAVRHWPARRQ